MKRSQYFLASLILVAGCAKPAEPTKDAGEDAAPVTVELATVKTEPFELSLNLDGTFAADQGDIAKLAPSAAGRVTALFVKEGDVVKQGRLLAQLDSRVQSAQGASAAAALDSAQIQLGQSRNSLTSSEIEQQNSVSSANLALLQAEQEAQNSLNQASAILEQSRVDRLKLRNGARPQELAQSRELTIQARAVLNHAQSELDRDQKLWPEGYIARRQLDDAQTGVDTAASALRSAQESESLLKAGARPEDLQAADSKLAAAESSYLSAKSLAKTQVEVAKEALAHARATEIQLRNRRGDVAVSQSLAKQKEADLVAARASAQLLTIRAPFDGTVLHLSAAVGEQVDTTTSILSVLKSHHKTNFIASALPDQASRIAFGMSVKFESKHREYSGVVQSISPPDAGSSLCTIRVLVSGEPNLGAFGSGRFLIKRIDKGLIVPSASVALKDGKNVVFKDVKGVAKLVEVELGPERDGKIAILSGLHSGDSIVASGSNELDDGTKITPPKEESKESSP